MGSQFRGMLRAAAATLVAAVPALALDLPGSYGNETGCHAEMTGDYRDDDVLILRPHQIETVDMVCDFTGSQRSPDGATIVTASCESEGVTQAHMFKISDPDPENDTVLLFFADGALWDEIRLCR